MTSHEELLRSAFESAQQLSSACSIPVDVATELVIQAVTAYSNPQVPLMVPIAGDEPIRIVGRYSGGSCFNGIRHAEAGLTVGLRHSKVWTLGELISADHLNTMIRANMLNLDEVRTRFLTLAPMRVSDVIPI